MGWFGPTLVAFGQLNSGAWKIWADVSAANLISLFKLLGIVAVNAPKIAKRVI